MPFRVVRAGFGGVAACCRVAATLVRRRGRAPPWRPGVFAPTAADMNGRILADIGVLWCDLAYGASLREAAARPQASAPVHRSLRHAPWARFSDPEPASAGGSRARPGLARGCRAMTADPKARSG